MRRHLVLLLGLVLVSCVLFAHARRAASDDGSESSCTTAYGKTACGFHCTAGFGDVQCAGTPEGACLAAFGQVRCWDPPRRYRRLACEVGPAECLGAFGDIACGYGCVSGFGEVACSPRPGGSCVAANSHVTCSN